MNNELIPVTKPFLPAREEYDSFVNEIWEREWLTNNGPLVRELEEKLSNYLAVDNLYLVNNGTIALQLAIKALNLSGEIITTPFSFVATTSSIVWEGCQPVFADIDTETFNIDPNSVKKLIGPKTSAILATHCFGNACNVDSLEKIAKENNLKIIYDAAHCFGTKFNGKSIFEFGDISTTSFHATKLFHTIEGGAVFCKNDEVFRKIKLMRNFGHDGPDKFDGVGINGKNSEFHAAMGHCVLKHIDEILIKRQRQAELYDSFLKDNPKLKFQKIEKYCDFNYAYYSVLFEDEETLLRVKLALEKNNISPRRYFYPTLSGLDYIEKGDTPIADGISRRILCLPLYHLLKEKEIELISVIIKNHI